MRGLEQIPWLYDAGMALYEKIGFRRWREWLAGGATGPTLEVGTGTGRNLRLYRASTPVIGLELDRCALRAARRRAPHVPLVMGRAEALPFRDGVFETVVSGLVFCSVDDPQAGLREIRRVLTRGGALRMVEHVRSSHRRVAWLQDRIQPTWTAIAGGCHPNRDTEAAVEAAGFVIVPEGRRARGVMRRFTARQV